MATGWITSSFFLLAMFPYIAKSQSFFAGDCPNVPVKPNFDKNQYLGRWYQIKAYRFIIFQLLSDCVTATYALQPDGTIEVKNEGVNRWTGSKIFALGDAYSPNPYEPAKLTVGFGDTDIPNFSLDAGDAENGNYWVLDTDYTSYTLIYSCSPVFGILHADIVWILSRQPELSEEKIKELEDLLESYSISTKYMAQNNNTACLDYYKTL